MRRAAFAGLIPHAGAMCLLDEVLHWSEQGIACRAVSHLDPANPLRRAGRLGMVCAVEYALQAAALHGALRAGAPQPPGVLARLRLSVLRPGRLDDPAFGALTVAATCEHGDAVGLIYTIRIATEGDEALVVGGATIVLRQVVRAE